jgi:nucleoside-diphosphate-sugar epimerase
MNWSTASISSKGIFARTRYMLPRGRKIYVLDVAASTNLFRNERASLEVNENNYLGTINLVEAVSDYEIKMIYISTAFASGRGCGSTPGRPATDDEALFHSPYEYFKNKAERFLRDSVEQDGLLILRPSIVCGRMLDTPLYFTSKFDVFYGWAKFFYINRNRGERIRIFINTESVVNIMPVDYVAKAIVRSFLSETGELNIVHSHSVSNSLFFSRILDKLQFTGYDFVDTMPDRLSGFERSYYATVGEAFTPYLTSPPYETDASDIRSIMADTEEPDIIGHLDGILSYAIEREFLIESNPEKRVPALR